MILSSRPAINLDHNATTIIDPRVAQATHEAATTLIGNPSSQHALGQAAAAAIEQARQQAADALGASPREVIFTGGATEANNLALLGLWAANEVAGAPRRTIIVGATEHSAVLEPAKVLADRGVRVLEVAVLRDGRVDLDQLAELIDDDTLLVSIMLANNETGVLHPLDAVVELAHARGALVHTDAAQAPGRIPVDFADLGVDLMSVSGHKMYGPRGVGALLLDRYARVPGGASLLEPLIHGGGQERGLRPGTYNTAGIVGFGTAATLLSEHLTEAANVAARRDRLAAALEARLAGVSVNGARAPRLPNTLNVRFEGADAEAVLAGLPLLACSTGSACSSGTPHPSHVLTSMGLSAAEASECVRLSLAGATSDGEIDAAVDMLIDAVSHVRSSITLDVQ
ncbi:cysteine desulfurase family protein [Micromonospora palomenae]|uniref:cysteine desulfurase family protein n=1 Tax=Micromonospora palomenae TaxID=1461247 RepID=UPI003F8AD7DB